MPDTRERDPYTPPPMHHDRSGAVLRVAVLAAMLGAAGLGYAWFSQQPQTALVPEIVEDQQLADAGYQITPEAVPTTAPETAPTPVATPAPRRRSAPVERTQEPLPEPDASPAPAPVPAAPTPIPPVDMPPPGSVG